MEKTSESGYMNSAEKTHTWKYNNKPTNLNSEISLTLLFRAPVALPEEWDLSGSQLSVTPAPKYPIFSCGFHGQICSQCKNTHAHKIYIKTHFLTY